MKLQTRQWQKKKMRVKVLSARTSAFIQGNREIKFSCDRRQGG